MDYYKNVLPLFLLLGLSGNVAAVINVSGTLGKLVLFNVNFPVGSYVQWNYKNAPVYIQSPLRCLNPFVGRCNLYENGSLSINNVSYTDEGIYDLSVVPPESSTPITTSYQLGVYAPLSAPALRSITSTPLINGTNVTLQCDAGNQNVTSYSFYQNGQKITCSGRVICRGSFLDFAPILESDGGSYTCTIENPVSSNTSNSLILIVNVQVSNVAVTSNVSGLVWPGLDSVSLRCSADGTNVSYSWSLQGAAISGGGRYILTDNNATLIISPVSTDDSGSFICTATNIINRLNSRNVTFNLASPVSAVMLTNNTSAVLWAGEDSASFHCSAQGSAITFSWRLNGTQVLSKPPYSITQSDSPPNSTLTISPVSRNDAGPFTCTAYNRANSITSGAANLNINWSPDGNISCTAQPIGQIIQLGCSWPGGKPAADVTMIFDDVRNTSSNEVSRNVSSISNIHGSNLTCNGNQRRTSSCVLIFEPPMSPDHKNDTVTSGLVGGAIKLTVDLQAGGQSRATALMTQALPASFSWYQGNSSTAIQNGGKFKVDSTSYASTLNIDKLTEAESGDYKCVAENFIGKTTFLFNVKVSKSGGSSGGLDGGAIAGIVIGVLAGVAIIGIIVFFIVKKKKRSGEDRRLNDLDAPTGTVVYAEIKANNKPNGVMAETAITNLPQEEQDEVKYASLQLPNNPSVKAAAPENKAETIYSDVKPSTKR
ncbi:carcinoembryonic antigen-related cell adhesion molecule 1-like [Ranitomeya imitator]|uniref:carcinoembryonic antigen-related cell adhesion molecule 1-like n=1 Tax=Ranitomeya imitator TaxID=111125 RepID=UPI0037E87FAA